MTLNKNLLYLLALLFIVAIASLLLVRCYNPAAALMRQTEEELEQDRANQEQVGRAFGLYSMGEVAEAERLVQEVLLDDRNQISALSLQEMIAYNSGNFEVARGLAERMVHLTPRKAVAYNKLALAQMQLGDFADAEQNLLTALRYNPHEIRLQLNLAQVYYQQKKWPEALAMLQKARALSMADFAKLVTVGQYPELAGPVGQMLQSQTQLQAK